MISLLHRMHGANQAEIEEISARFQSRSTYERECGGEHLHALGIETVRKLNILLFLCCQVLRYFQIIFILTSMRSLYTIHKYPKLSTLKYVLHKGLFFSSSN